MPHCTSKYMERRWYPRSRSRRIGTNGRSTPSCERSVRVPPECGPEDAVGATSDAWNTANRHRLTPLPQSLLPVLCKGIGERFMAPGHGTGRGGGSRAVESMAPHEAQQHRPSEWVHLNVRPRKSTRHSSAIDCLSICAKGVRTMSCTHPVQGCNPRQPKAKPQLPTYLTAMRG